MLGVKTRLVGVRHFMHLVGTYSHFIINLYVSAFFPYTSTRAHTHRTHARTHARTARMHARTQTRAHKVVGVKHIPT